MDPQIAAAILLTLCLALILLTYVLGIEVGKASNLKAHPGYEAARTAL